MADQQRNKKTAIWLDIIPANKIQHPKKKKKRFKISIKIPKFKLSKKWVIPIIISILIITLISLYILILKPNQKNDNNVETPVGELVKDTPKFSTVLPENKNIDSLGGWTRVSPSDSEPTYAYPDKINDVPIIVSQQQLPESFESDTNEQIERFASQNNANEKITVGNVTVYIGTSAKGPQSLFFIKNKLLILIKSDQKISSDHWANYISSLE